MKKIYLLGFAAILAFSVNAQEAIQLKAKKGNSAVSKNGAPISTQQVYGNLVCLTTYSPSTTMNLVFKFTQTTNNDEWIDMFELVLPAGITPNSSPNAIFPSAGTGGGTGTTAPLNPISGQTISWGAATQTTWGAIHTLLNVGQTFTVNVTIGAISGVQTANFTAYGDTYTDAGNPVAGDLVGTASISDVPFSDMYTKLFQPVGGGFTSLQNCGMTTNTLVARYVNGGTQNATNISMNYSINGVAGTAGVYTGTIVPGDSVTISLGTYNFSPDDVYDIKAWANIASDIDMTNDTSETIFSNSNAIDLTSAAYTNSVETVYEAGSVLKTWLGSGSPFTQSTFDSHSGANSLELYISNTAPPATYTSVNILPCLNVVTGETYRISFWKKIEAGQNGQTGITTGTLNTSVGTGTFLKAFSAFTTGVWVKDSVSYTATATETRYFAIRGKGTIAASAATDIDIYIDDINIQKISGSVGIKTISANDAISIFPNPTSGILNINAIDANSSVEVINIIGEKVYSNTLVKGNNTVDLSGLANGAYFVKLNSNNTITTKKVVLSK